MLHPHQFILCGTESTAVPEGTKFASFCAGNAVYTQTDYRFPSCFYHLGPVSQTVCNVQVTTMTTNTVGITLPW